MQKDVEKAYAVLELERKIVGVKIAKTKEEFDSFNGITLDKSLSYCVAVKSAMTGKSIKLTKETSGCIGSTRALGIDSPSEGFLNGIEGCKMGLYSDETVSSKVASTMKICPKGTYGVIIKPLEMFEESPDVVLIVSDSKNMMRIIQGYSYIYGMDSSIKMSGNQAVCVECTVTPYISGNINVSMFCSGTRFLAKWKDTEVAVGIPYEKFSNTIEGIRQTVNAVELDNRKVVIEKRLHSAGISDVEIIYGKTYYYSK